MPSKNKAQRTALIIKKGIGWVREHGFDKVKGERKKKRTSKRRSNRSHAGDYSRRRQ